MAQQVRNLAFSLQQLGLLLWHGFKPIPGEWPKKKKKINLTKYYVKQVKIEYKVYLLVYTMSLFQFTL